MYQEIKTIKTMKRFWVDLKALSKVEDVKTTTSHIKNCISEDYLGGVTDEGVLWYTLDGKPFDFLIWFIIKVRLFFRYGNVFL